MTSQRHPDNEREPGIVVVRCESALFFANADAVRGAIRANIDDGAFAVVLDAETVPAIDVTAVGMLTRLADELRRDGIELVFARNVGDVRELVRLGASDAPIPRYPTVHVAIDALRSQRSPEQRDEVHPSVSSSTRGSPSTPTAAKQQRQREADDANDHQDQADDLDVDTRERGRDGEVQDRPDGDWPGRAGRRSAGQRLLRSVPLGPALGQTLGNMLEVLVAALAHPPAARARLAAGQPRRCRAPARRDRRRATAISAIGRSAVAAGPAASSPPSELPGVARTWWLGDAAGARRS